MGFKTQTICQERLCNAQRKENAEKKSTDNGLTYLGGSCLGGGGGVHLFSGDGLTLSTSLFSSSTTPEPCHSRFRLEAMDTDKPPPLETKAFFVSSFRLLKLSKPRLAFSGSTTRRLACSNARLTTRLWMSDIALQSFCKPASLSFPPNDAALIKMQEEKNCSCIPTSAWG